MVKMEQFSPKILLNTYLFVFFLEFHIRYCPKSVSFYEGKLFHYFLTEIGNNRKMAKMQFWDSI